MFERFRKTRPGAEDEGSVAVRERGGNADGAVAASDAAPERDAERFSRADDVTTGRSAGERDQEVVAGGGSEDLAADRAFERDEMSRGARDGDGVPDDREGTLGRDAARDDLDGDRHGRGRGGTAAAAGAGMAAGAAHRHDDDLDDGRLRHGAAGDGAPTRVSPGERDRGMVAGESDAGVRDGDRTALRDPDVADEPSRRLPVMGTDALESVRARQRDRFGGIQWGADFFGWLCAIGLASLLTAALVGAGVALGLSTDDATNADTAPQIGLGGGIALIAVLAIAWFCGGYVAGRMARFDGVRQGLGVWLWTLLSAVVIAAVAAIGGTEYDVYQRLNLPRIAIGDSTLNTGGAIAGAVAVVATLLFAVLGGKAGERFHKRVDRVATDEYVVER